MMQLSTRAHSIGLAMALLAAVASPSARAAKKEETVTCAVCGKKVPKSQAIKVIQNGRVYYVCSEACLVKFKDKSKK